MVGYLIFHFDFNLIYRSSIEKQKNWKAGVVLICFILALPFVEQIKNSIRSGEAISTQLTFFDYADSFNQQFMKVVGRVQTVSHVAFITDNINQLQNLKIMENLLIFLKKILFI